MWSELSAKDKKVLYAIADFTDQSIRILEIRNQLKMPSSLFSIYRDRLIKQGLITMPQYGYLELSLPRFREFIRMKRSFSEE